MNLLFYNNLLKETLNCTHLNKAYFFYYFVGKHFNRCRWSNVRLRIAKIRSKEFFDLWFQVVVWVGQWFITLIFQHQYETILWVKSATKFIKFEFLEMGNICKKTSTFLSAHAKFFMAFGRNQRRSFCFHNFDWQVELPSIKLQTRKKITSD